MNLPSLFAQDEVDLHWYWLHALHHQTTCALQETQFIRSTCKCMTQHTLCIIADWLCIGYLVGITFVVFVDFVLPARCYLYT